jgi:hypothetical protein
MKTIAFLHPLRLAAAVVALLFASQQSIAAPATTQTLTLSNGWNAVHIEVLPDDPELSAIFSALAVESVWTYEDRAGAPDFIQEVSEDSLAKAGWLSWVQTNRVDAFQNDLFQLQVNRAYLIKFTNATPATVTLTGRPSLRTRAWKPDAFNFRGFAVDPALPPTFLGFFQPSPAHYAEVGGLQPAYRLNAAGVWALVAPSDLMRSGEAYWVFCKGNSDYVAPLTVTPDFGDGLNFGVGLNELELSLMNLRATSLNATLHDLSEPATSVFAYGERLADSTLTWPELPLPLVRTVAAGTDSLERFAVRRAAMTTDVVETVWEITDGAGSRLLVPVSAVRTVVAEEGSEPSGGRAARAGIRRAASAEAISHAGLWVGTATLNAVSEAHSGPLTTNVSSGFTIQLETNSVSHIVTTNRVPNSVIRTSVSMLPTPTGGDFNLRLLLHVDGTGQTRLLKEVIEMWQDGVSTNDASGNTTVAVPGRYVLVTDDSLIGQFTGVSSRDGVPVGRRLSTAGFDFADNELPLSGDFAVGSSVIGTNTMSATFARNPFKHRYHPDHAQGFDIKRVIELELSSAPTNAPPGYGERVLDGIYRETVTGLHRTNIVVGGTFRLTRVANATVLNQ